jgi:hypothetical protein
MSGGPNAGSVIFGGSRGLIALALTVKMWGTFVKA